MNTIVCPKCGKTLTVSDPSRAFVFCEYCGTKINLNINVNLNYSKSEHTERIVDEAKIIRKKNGSVNSKKQRSSKKRKNASAKRKS